MQAEGGQGFQQFLLIVQHEATGHPGAAVGPVNRRLNAAARLEHQLQHAAGPQHPGELRQHVGEYRIARDVLNDRVAQHKLKAGVVEGQRLLNVGYLQAVGELRAQATGYFDVFGHRVQPEHLEPHLFQVRHFQRAGAATGIQPRPGRSQLRQPPVQVAVFAKFGMGAVGKHLAQGRVFRRALPVELQRELAVMRSVVSHGKIAAPGQSRLTGGRFRSDYGVGLACHFRCYNNRASRTISRWSTGSTAKPISSSVVAPIR